jgi:hypothetical protein
MVSRDPLDDRICMRHVLAFRERSKEVSVLPIAYRSLGSTLDDAALG